MSWQRFAVFILALSVCIGQGVAVSRGQVAGNDRNTGNSAAGDVLLDGTDWRMGAFDFGEGVAAGVAAVEFNDGGFRAVTVPGDNAIAGLAYWRCRVPQKRKALMEVNGKEWWYRKHFHASIASARNAQPDCLRWF